MTGPVTLKNISAHYDAILCDVWGVIRDGKGLLPVALDALAKFRDSGKPIVLISNSPQRAFGLKDQLAREGAHAGLWDDIVTSGDATHAALSGLAPGPAYKLGPDWDDEIYEGTGLDFAPLKEAAFISCTGLVDYETESVADYEDLLREAKLRHLPMVCANPDKIVQNGDRLLPCGGALAERYSQLGGEVIFAGKPHPPIYDLALNALENAGLGHRDPARILAIGDGIETDLIGAAREGMDALFITAGIFGHQVQGDATRGDIEALLAPYKTPVRWFAPALIWD
ncbi:TIGR01459 family HAD-type hydrolase [Woodsholea maritima]|uniref:TIGR01459 family HAD-type hydrolase n=1 Tax=Woodsholea maritima TaxID=240237 RepID=UPI00037FE069|nr:TIGR01459 family HAD-type hydrolase [Woodsholea maritima]